MPFFGPVAPQVLSMIRKCQAKNVEAALKKDKSVFDLVAKANKIVKWNEPSTSDKDASLLARTRVFGAQAGRFPGWRSTIKYEMSVVCSLGTTVYSPKNLHTICMQSARSSVTFLNGKVLYFVF